MEIPRHWRKAEERVESPEGRRLRLKAWGWSADSDDEALAKARIRLRRLVDRVRAGQPLPTRYEYGSRPVREEILEEYPDDSGAIKAILTRNGYGSRILNTDRLLFIDVDRKPDGLIGWFKRRFSKASGSHRLRSALARFSPVTFRLYRTAAGFRAMSVSHTFTPDGAEAQEILAQTGADPAFVHLCRLQKSFRARLTPKFWRCGIRGGPPPYPREDSLSREAFVGWLRNYEQRSESYGTCEYLETIGSRSVHTEHADLLRLHDGETRATGGLTLA